MKIEVHSSIDNSVVKEIELSDKIYDQDFNKDLVHQLITTYRNNGRSGSAKQKTRSEVSGGGAKPWRQKGTGRARSGTSRSPIWRKGGVTFASRPKKYNQKINKKMYRKALSCIFSELLRNDRIKIVNDIELKTPKTKEIISVMNNIEVKSCYLLLSDKNEIVENAIQNTENYIVSNINSINPAQLIKYDNTVLTEDAANKIERWLSK
ncbi:MAG: 50S ribosomal protein L4 [Methylococcales bacterium]|jgi:large subunit ribosomal protein L4|nr:50S ribosomal protein L4 [Methylococcales bacterium]